MIEHLGPSCVFSSSDRLTHSLLDPPYDSPTAQNVSKRYNDVMLTSILFQPVYGCFPRWPDGGTSWLHPEDLDVALRLIPSDRIFRREWRGGEFSNLIYGEDTIRARPVLWNVVPSPVFSVGEEVEIKSQMGKRDPGLAIVREVVWNADVHAVQYELEQREMMLPQLFDTADLNPVESLNEGHEPLRESTWSELTRQPPPERL